MPINLANIVRTYLEDKEFQDESAKILEARNNTLPTLKGGITKFIDGTFDIYTFRDNLDKALPTRDAWGVRGMDFLMEINKLAKYHAAPSGSEIAIRVEQTLRQLLTGLQAQNLGERIEQFHTFLLQERDRRRQANAGRGTIVSPGNSALIISLFACWLNWSNESIVYYLSLRQGLKTLLDVGLLPHITGLRVDRDRVLVTSNADHQAIAQALTSLANATPTLKTGHGWTELFPYWLTRHPEALEEANTFDTTEEPTTVQVRTIDHEPLMPIPEAHLSAMIEEVRRHILIDEKLVRRIYHALLAGHVILTGPPGTGKTALARLIPELLWQQGASYKSSLPTAYTTKLVTATDEWSVRTLIGGLAPSSVNGQVVYRVQYGHLTKAIQSNWACVPHDSQASAKARVTVFAPSILNSGEQQEFLGLWLIIDEFNRAPIDLALGDALTALSNGTTELPLPKDFRIIGTLNSFDRNYLNQISEALKRRFSFIEVLPPPRVQRNEEQKIVLRKAFESTRHLHDEDIEFDENSRDITYGQWMPGSPSSGAFISIYRTDGTWGSKILKETFELAWCILEVIRIYRQLGTAQAIALIRELFIAGILQQYSLAEQWLKALDSALCDTIADQLQRLMPDELEVLYWYIKRPDAETFINMYNRQLARLAPRRLKAQLEALSSVVDDDGQEILSEDEVEGLELQAEPKVAADVLTNIFHLDKPSYLLPQFARRLRVFKAERGL